MSEIPSPQEEIQDVQQPTSQISTESNAHTGLKDKLLALLHMKPTATRDIKVKPVSVKLDREQVRSKLQEDPNQA